MSDEDKGTVGTVSSVMTLSTAPTEYAKAIARLMQAALLFSMHALQQGVRNAAALADVNDLSFRRGGGRIDLMANLGDEKPQELLLDAAIAFAEAYHDAKDPVEGQEAPVDG